MCWAVGTCGLCLAVACAVHNGGWQLVAGAVTREWVGLTLDALAPGMLVNARVRNVLGDGLLLSFLTFFSGTVDAFHLGTVRME